MVPEQYRALFDKLHHRTQKGEVNWRSTADEDVLAVYFKEFSLTMRKGEDPRDGPFVRWEIIREDGTDIDGFYVDIGEDDWRKAEDLYDAARRKALRLDDALDAIMKELEESDEVGLDKKPSSTPFGEDDDLPF